MHFAALPLGSSLRWKLPPAVGVVALGDWMFMHDVGGAYYGMLALTLLAAMLAGRPAVRRDLRALAATCAATLFALALVYDTSVVAWTLFWLAAGMASLLPLTAGFDDGWRWSHRLLWNGLRVPFGPVSDARRVAKLRAAGRIGRFDVRRAAATMALPLAGSATIAVLFSAANPLFEQMVRAFMPSGVSPQLLLRCGFWLITFTMAWSLLKPRRLLRASMGFSERQGLPLPGVTVASVTLSLIAFNFIFAMQNLMDAAYLWGLAPLPAGMTLAGYAHRGAYPLIATALLAALFVIVTLRPGSETARSRLLRGLVTLWIAQNVFLVVSSMLRTIDYIEAYSLTRLRIAALVWMALVAFGLATICWRLLRQRSAAWLINMNMAALTLILTAASFTDLGAIAAQWNVRHAREAGGKGAALDLCYLEGLQDSSLLPLLELETRSDLRPDLRERVQAVRMQVYANMLRKQQSAWTWLRTRRLQAASKLIARVHPVPIAQGARTCGGVLLLPYQPEDPAPLPTAVETRQDPALTGSRKE